MDNLLDTNNEESDADAICSSSGKRRKIMEGEGELDLRIQHPSAQSPAALTHLPPLPFPPALNIWNPYSFTVERPTLPSPMSYAAFATSSQNPAPNVLSMVRAASPAVGLPVLSKSQPFVTDSEPSLSPTLQMQPYMQRYRGALEAVNLIAFDAQMIAQDYIVKNDEGKFLCVRSECANVQIAKITSGRVHNLRHNPQNIFFCLNCGSAFPFESLIVKHMIEIHHQMRRPEFYLRCPLCPAMPPFKEVEVFRKHMAGKSVQHSFSHHSYSFQKKCKLRFHSVEARLRHDLEHRTAQNAQCCCVCGTSQNWWSIEDLGNELSIEHTYIHAFSLWGMCRECGLCYPNELKNQQYHLHFKEMHMIIQDNDMWYCKICEKNMDTWNVEVHALQRHFVIGVKTGRHKSYAVETSQSMMLAFLGYPVSDYAKI